jgi:hypothetical protein
MTGAWLTWRMHRFEVIFVLVIAAALGVSAWIVGDQIRSIGLTDALCWPRPEDGGYATPTCDRMMESYWAIESQGGLVRVALSVAPILLGLIVGVPIVARELELRTAGFSWALEPHRQRWLLARSLPMAGVALLGLVVVAWAGTTLFDAMWLARSGPDLTEVAAQGIALVARGLAALAVALLIGALAGRTMPALLIAVVVMGAWALVLVPQAQNALAKQRAVWQREDEDSWRTGGSMLTYVDYAYFDPTLPGLPGEPGARIDQDAAWAAIDERVRVTCGDAPVDDTGESAAYHTWAACADPIYEEGQHHTVQATRVVPRAAWGDFVALDVVMSMLLGGAALILTIPVVGRRRPG